MNASTAPLVQRFLALCRFDQRLRDAIASFEVNAYPDGMIATIQLTAPDQIEWLWHFMPQVTQILYRLGNFKAIGVQTANKFIRHEMRDLLDTFPDAGDPDLPLPSKQTQPAQTVWTDACFNALANYKTRDCHVFVIGIDGIYKDARLQRDSPATVTPAQMIDHPIVDFIGETGASYLMEQLLAAYEQNEERDIDYPVRHPNGEARRYRGTLIPIPAGKACILLSYRVTQVSQTHSLVVPG